MGSYNIEGEVVCIFIIGPGGCWDDVVSELETNVADNNLQAPLLQVLRYMGLTSPSS